MSKKNEGHVTGQLEAESSDIETNVDDKDSAKEEKIKYFTSIYPGNDREIPEEFTSLIKQLEHEIGEPIWLIIQQGDGDLDEISNKLVTSFSIDTHNLPINKPITLLIDSSGGYGESAYRLARMIQRHCGNFTVVIPRRAKSAATLFALGAESILMGLHAELGPLDAQLFDPDREEYRSALDEVQSLERLHAFTLDAIDQTMIMLLGRTGKKTEKLLPMCMDFVAKISAPLFDQIDTIHYTRMSRVLKEAEEYAVRLLVQRRSMKDATRIARQLVEHYPTHGFFIDSIEAKEGIGLPVEIPNERVAEIIDAISHYLDESPIPLTIIGQVKEMSSHD